MTAKHTPGPWQVTDGKNYTTEIQAKSQRGKLWVVARTTAAKTGQDVAQANARLIVAAPELLAMLIDLREQGGFENLNSLEECDALIAKATGEDAP